MKITERKVYLFYILIGLCYIISKAIWFPLGYICFGGLIHGFVATVLTVGIAILAFKEYEKATKTVAHWLAALFPLLILPLTPIIMMHNLGEKIFVPNKIIIFLLWEALAFIQVILAISMFKGLILKRAK